MFFTCRLPIAPIALRWIPKSKAFYFFWNKVSNHLMFPSFHFHSPPFSPLFSSKHYSYGVPQTRQRTYMFVWQPTKDKNGNADIADDLGTYWEALVKHLKSPVRHSLEAFILQVDHDIIRVFREGKALHAISFFPYLSHLLIFYCSSSLPYYSRMCSVAWTAWKTK